MKKSLVSRKCANVGELRKALKHFHSKASISFTIQEHHRPGEIYLIESIEDGWDRRRSGLYPIALIPEKGWASR